MRPHLKRLLSPRLEIVCCNSPALLNIGADQPNAHRSKAALLEFLPTAARARVVSPDAFERIFEALATGMISLCLSPPSLLVISVLLAKAVPSGQLFYGIAE